MLYLIKDKTLLGVKTVHICTNETEVLQYLKNVENLRKFKGDIKIEKVFL